MTSVTPGEVSYGIHTHHNCDVRGWHTDKANPPISTANVESAWLTAWIVPDAISPEACRSAMRIVMARRE